MTVEQIVALGPALTAFLAGLGRCFGERRLLEHFRTYCHGLLANLPRKSVEPIALRAGGTVRALQMFLTQRVWDQARLRDLLQQGVATEHGPPLAGEAPPGTPNAAGVAAADLGSLGLIDETSVVKKGRKTPGVQRQYCGAVGKIENGIVTVHLGYRYGQFQTLIDSDLFLPESWAQDRERCRQAHIPDQVVYRPKWRIALDQVQHALGNGVRFTWLTFDEYYGSKPEFLSGLEALGQNYVAEVPKNFRCFPVRPQYHSLRKEFSSKKVYNVGRWSPAFIYQEWRDMTLERETVEPQTWSVKAAQVYLTRDGRPTDRTYWLIVAWNRETGEHKYFVANAPPTTALLTLLRVAFSRAHVEHLFRVAKSEIGLAHFEGRSYVGLLRHLVLCQTVMHFLAQQTDALRGEKSAGHLGADRPSPQHFVCRLAALPPAPPHRSFALGT
jgi:SRSO17 transposase